MLAARLSRGYWFSGDLERAGERAELALDIAEAQVYPAVLAIALRAKAAVVFSRGHFEEATRPARARARDRGRPRSRSRTQGTCYFLLSDGCFRRDRYAEALGYLDEALALARKLGDRPYEWASLAERTYPLYMLGRWDEAQAAATSSPPSSSRPAA